MTVPVVSPRDALDGAQAADAPTWRRARALFSLDERSIRMDATTVGAKLEAAGLDESVCEAEFPDVRRAIAPGYGCDPDEIVVTHSTTDSIRRIVEGLDFEPGDEIVTTNHEHYGTLAPLALLRNRRGVVVKQIELPIGNDQRAEDYVARFEAGLTPRTKLMIFSSPTATTGTLLPIRDLAELAQAHGVPTVVDGAHLVGMMASDFHRLGVDFLAGSGYKWQFGPAGSGLLYIRNKVLAEHNPLPLAPFWPVGSILYPLAGALPARTSTRVPSYDIAEHVQNIGSASVERVMRYRAACAIWDDIGRDRIEHHVVGLATRLKQRIAEIWGEQALLSPLDDVRLRSGLTAFCPFRRAGSAADATCFRTFETTLATKYGVVVKYTRYREPRDMVPRHAIRVATRIFHDDDDVDHAVEAMATLAEQMER